MRHQFFGSNLSSDNPKAQYNFEAVSAPSTCYIPKSMIIDKFLNAEEGFEYNKRVGIIKPVYKAENIDTKELSDILNRIPDDGSDENPNIFNSHHIDAT